MLQADPRKVSMRAKKRGLPQLGTLGEFVNSQLMIKQSPCIPARENLRTVRFIQ